MDGASPLPIGFPMVWRDVGRGATISDARAAQAGLPSRPMAPSHDAARLAGITRLSLRGGRGPTSAWVFDPHRLALPAWAAALEGQPPALLVTLDRHFDLVPPEAPAAVPDRSAGLRAIDEHARWSLTIRNTDHVVAAMEAGIVGDVLAIARASPVGAHAGESWTDRRGGVHRLLRARTVDQLAADWGTPSATPEAKQLADWLEGGGPVLLDVDLDCFTTPSDADPTSILPWPRELIRDFLLPPDSEPFWEAVLGRCVALTLAREPYHCGGLAAGARLFLDVGEVLFRELLRVDVP